MIISANIYKQPNITQQVITIPRILSIIYHSPLQTIFKGLNVTSNITLGRSKPSVIIFSSYDLHSGGGTLFMQWKICYGNEEIGCSVYGHQIRNFLCHNDRKGVPHRRKGVPHRNTYIIGHYNASVRIIDLISPNIEIVRLKNIFCLLGSVESTRQLTINVGARRERRVWHNSRKQVLLFLSKKSVVVAILYGEDEVQYLLHRHKKCVSFSEQHTEFSCP